MPALRWCRSQLPFGWVCFSNGIILMQWINLVAIVSIAFRLGLFL